MNWLAHLYLSEANTGYQLGNLMADILRPEDRTGYRLGREMPF
jgi:acyl carrier protein phosphodiesterase